MITETAAARLARTAETDAAMRGVPRPVTP